MSEKDKKRLALTAKNIPDDIYIKLEQLGSERRLTPYIIHLVEKEAMMDTLVESLPSLLSEIKILKDQVSSLSDKLENINVVPAPEMKNHNEMVLSKEDVQTGKLEINDNIESEAMEEDMDSDFDF